MKKNLLAVVTVALLSQISFGAMAPEKVVSLSSGKKITRANAASELGKLSVSELTNESVKVLQSGLGLLGANSSNVEIDALINNQSDKPVVKLLNTLSEKFDFSGDAIAESKFKEFLANLIADSVSGACSLDSAAQEAKLQDQVKQAYLKVMPGREADFTAKWAECFQGA